jgi:hypothetical protein
MNLPITLLAAALVAVSTPLLAQAPKAEGRRFDCSQAKDPKACEERRDKMKSMREQAEKACQGKQGAEHGECMAHEMCAQTKDPKACEERMSKMKENYKSAREQAMKACEGRQGAEREQCLVHEGCAQSKDPAKCEAMGKERMARREKIREACKDKRGDDLKACIREHRGDK